ncbi:ADP-ribosylglycohydrolase family protein, partial [Xanthomonas citri pv. citri]|nr:ADP-ribosylglycohydrolase family protein [Xanthomonas citri pv. citri]
RGLDLAAAVAHARAWLDSLGEEAEEARAAVAAAVDLADTVDADPGAPGALPTALGQGWVAEEALAIALYAALTAQAAHPEI